MSRSQLSCGIVGLPNVGKSTLFNALTASGAQASNYPFCTIDPNVGVVELYDPRLEVLSQLSKSRQILPAAVTFVDIAGLVAGASQGEGLGNKFLANIRETDAIVQVVRCFEETDVVHVAGTIDPLRDIEVINLELCLADLQMVQNVSAKLERQVKSNKEVAPTLALLQRLAAHLDAGKPARLMAMTPEERALLQPYPLLSAKKVLYVANVGEEDLPALDNRHVAAVRRHGAAEGSPVIAICAKLEAEIALLAPAEQREFLDSLGLQQSGLQRLARASFDMLGLITYITTGEIETRAWTIARGTTAVEAAGKIHGDIQKGFIRAETIAYDDMVACGGRVQAREAGKARSEGRDYVVQDGDVILFLHN